MKAIIRWALGALLPKQAVNILMDLLDVAIDSRDPARVLAVAKFNGHREAFRLARQALDETNK